jgi:hypothetical protein
MSDDKPDTVPAAPEPIRRRSSQGMPAVTDPRLVLEQARAWHERDQAELADLRRELDELRAEVRRLTRARVGVTRSGDIVEAIAPAAKSDPRADP